MPSADVAVGGLGDEWHVVKPPLDFRTFSFSRRRLSLSLSLYSLFSTAVTATATIRLAVANHDVFGK